MDMTFENYIKNPMGTGSAVLANSEMYKNFYSNKWDKIIVRENGTIQYKLYKAKDAYYAHIKIPSENIDKFFYDVVIEFKDPGNKSIGADRNLKRYNVRFFSNDPAFVFTYAHAFIKNGLFIKELSDKMSKEAIKKKAVVRNPGDQPGYVKTLYFAYLFMNNRNLFDKVKYTEKYNEKIIKSDIMEADTKIAQRQAATTIVKVQKKEKVNKMIDVSHEKRNTSKKIKNVMTTKQIAAGHIVSGNNIKSTKKTSTIKRKR